MHTMNEAVGIEMKNIFPKNTEMSKNMVNHTVDFGEGVKEVLGLRVMATKMTKGTVT